MPSPSAVAVTTPGRHRIVAAGLTAAVTAVGYRIGRSLLPSSPWHGDRTSSTQQTWWRLNHAGRSVDLVGGPAVVAGLIAGSLSTAPGHAAVAAATGAVGLYDDLAGSPASRGLAGHLRRLVRGEVTSGAVKVAVLGLTGLGYAMLAGRRRAGRAGPRVSASGGGPAAVFDVVADTVLVAGTANVVNLLDLRPGRAAKVVLAGGAAVALIAGSVVPMAAAAAILPSDLSEQTMLGDSGANALGAVLGAALVDRGPRSVRLVAALTLVGLTLASERVSFSAVIARTGWLDRLDRWGRPAR